MAITFKAVVKALERREDRTWNVKIRVIKDRKIALIPTNY